ncbi:Ca2+-transporting ATPase [Atopostipes suicloacalis DSM 15692]|uniref:P-type Ca(2+) transporter n=1 Tax=Atopostipes suicloacalis DSM 15692 TaxID=1121025 RepID=A0A1M4WUE1_9LACT|nr:cation-translocating P-type ATPase [Atopostipes suicloacalis]SHE84815.1 Ca2+-transporting ATPase [Atopostipes suicloacalis DSM 15692]
MNEMDSYRQSSDEVIEKLGSNAKTGLSSDEAAKRLEKYGPNEIQKGEHTSLLQKFIAQFKDFMIIVLLVAAIVSWLVSGDLADAVVILIVVFLNAIMGVFQESKAEEAIDALQSMASPEAHVRRNGKTEVMKSTEIVPGDIVLLEAGDVVPADMRLIEENSLQVEEAALTGESVPTEKDATPLDEEAQIADRTNMVYSSTNVTYGRGLGIVTSTAMDTEVGHIASMLETTEAKKTPLQEDQEDLGKALTYMIIGIAILTFFVGTIFQNIPWDQMLLVAVSLAVAAIPEGLPAITTIILSIGTQNMANRNALVRSLPAVETLGSTQVIGSDKTGTLTLNQMTIEKVYYDGAIHDDDEEIDLTHPLVKSVTFANDTDTDNEGNLVGDPTEVAMVRYALDKGFYLEEELNKTPRIGEVPFDSDRKLMSTIHQLEDGRYLVTVKGAPDQLIDRTTQIFEKGDVRELTDADKTHILDSNKELAQQALRVLGGAYKIIEEVPSELNTDTIEKDLIFTGLVAMIDPEREEARGSIEKARRAGIRTIMITGDHAITAQAIAERLTILDEADENNQNHVITGAELSEMSDEELAHNIENYSVYARVSPEHKVRIIRAWQSKNKVISMTGDGVNDAPSLKQANIGVGMGITGTEVSKGASDMVLADDNFATIVKAVEEGRKVFTNIQKAVQYLLSANLGEVLTLFIATLLGWQILEPIHILWINLVTDVFPAIALGMEEAEKDSMDYEPRSPESSFLSNGVLPSIIYQGILEGAVTLFVYWFGRYQYAPTLGPGVDAINLAETMAFATLGTIQLFHAFNVKHVFDSLFSTKPFNNKYLNGASLLSAALLYGVILIPGINNFFDVTLPTTEGWLIIIGASVSIIVFVEIIKWIFRKTGFADKYKKKAIKL